MNPRALAYFSKHSLVTNPMPFDLIVNSLPSNVWALCKQVNNILIHKDLALRLRPDLSNERLDEVNLRYVSAILERARQLHPSGLVLGERDINHKVIGTCRDYAVLLTSLLRAKGTAARARCGFANYFQTEPANVDHWVCEYWDNVSGSWKLADPELVMSPLRPGLSFDYTDVPRHHFLTASAAWEMCKDNPSSRQTFGIGPLRGLWFVMGNVIRDFAALNKIEVLPWDIWGCMTLSDEDIDLNDIRLMDLIARYSADPVTWASLMVIEYLKNDKLRVPQVVRSMTPLGVRLVGLPMSLDT